MDLMHVDDPGIITAGKARRAMERDAQRRADHPAEEADQG